MIPFLKRWTLLLHHYLGTGLCLLAVVWFASGIVLMYSPFPAFDEPARLARVAALDCTRCVPSLTDALGAMPQRDTTSTPRLGMLFDRPVWRYRATDGRWHLLRADTLATIDSLSAADAERVAAEYMAFDTKVARTTTLLREPDQWTVEAVLRHQLPLYRVTFTDPAHTQVYVSLGGGEVMVTSTRRERALAYVGAIPHWIYPRILRIHVSAWQNVVIVLSGLGVLLSLSGLAIGLWQYRFRRRAARAGRPFTRSPYRPWWMRWHHYLGLLFGVVTFTWLLSGMLSVDPLDWSPGDAPTAADEWRFAGGALESGHFTVAPNDAVRAFSASSAPRELRPRLVGGAAYWTGVDATAQSRVVAADDRAPAVDGQIPAGWLTRAAQALTRATRPSTATLGQPDDYYRDTPERRRSFPVVRLQLDDAERSAFYLDPRTGSIAMKQVTRSRWERWLYTGLHDFDFAALTTRRPLWDIVVIIFSLGGLALSITGTVVGWRWIAPRFGLRSAPRR